MMDNKNNRIVISALVENKYGVLTRVAGMFTRKGFNIDSLTVGETEDPNFSRMTIVITGGEFIREQMVKQLAKLYNVKGIKTYEDGTTVERELCLIKVRNTPENRSEITAAAEIYRAKIVDYTTDVMTVEITGEPSKINAFIEIAKPLGILETCRTGVVAIERGRNTMTKIIK